MTDPLKEMQPEAIIDLIDDLIELNRDAHTGYNQAAEAVENATYRQILTDHAAQRQEFVAELSQIVERYGGKPPETGHPFGALHRAWMQLKNALASGDKAILAECDQAETVLINQYKHAVRQPLPPEVRDVITRQMSDLRVTAKKIHDLAVVLGG